jgi:hypothetical protein
LKAENWKLAIAHKKGPFAGCSDRITGWKLAIVLVAKWKNKRIASRIRVSAPCDGSDRSSGRTPGREIGGKKHNVFFF